MLKAQVIFMAIFTILIAYGTSVKSSELGPFGGNETPFSHIRTVTIFYIDWMDQRGTSQAELRRNAVAKLIIKCGSSCRQNIPKITIPIETAKKVNKCPRADVMYVLNFDDRFTIEYFRGGNIFRFHDTCFESSNSSQVLRDIFAFFR